jgi:hypothetical protein
VFRLSTILTGVVFAITSSLDSERNNLIEIGKYCSTGPLTPQVGAWVASICGTMIPRLRI